MPKPVRSQMEVEKVREEIVRGALALIVDDGLESLSMSRLGKRLNMTGANIYNYFQNRDSLLIAIHKKIFRDLFEKLSASVAPETDPAVRARNLVRAFVRFGVENVNIYDMMFTRPRLQYRDYIGTPQEDQAREEYLSSLEGLLLAFRTMEELLGGVPGMTPDRLRLITVKLISEIHGIISLMNSRILIDMTDDPEGTLSAIVDTALESVISLAGTPAA
ncbi:MAG: TetR/AcrR family transcriptional regulator [Thermodesulfobacteriota bacterium]